MTTPLDVYKQYFPHFTPSPFQQDLIDNLVTNMDIWHEVLTMWAGNDFRPASIKKMIDLYDEKVGAMPSIPQWQININNCNKCDERGYILVNGKHEVCKHG